MARRARIKAMESGDVFYHLYSRVAGEQGYYPLASKESKRKLVGLLKHYQSIYQMNVAGFCIMGNHYHLVVEFEDYRELSRDELYKIACKMYKKESLKLSGWTPDKWEKFNKRIYDVSEFMRNFQAGFARWYNVKNNRKGAFWGDRFKSTLLEDTKAMIDCLLYVELNPVRAGIVERPEDFDGNSLYYRHIRDDRWMIKIQDIINDKTRKEALKSYKAAIYYRGNVPTKRGQLKIPDFIIKQEEELDFKLQGTFEKRMRHFVDGMVIGSNEYVSNYLKALKDTGQYLRRKNPIKAKDGESLFLREQRGTG